MLVKIYDVRVPDSTTRFYQVPEYDIPIIRKLWANRLKPDAYGNRAEIQAFDMGVIEPRSLHSEKLRIRRDWSTKPDGYTHSAWEEVYPTDAAFHDAWQKAVDACAADKAKREAATEQAPRRAAGRPRGRRGAAAEPVAAGAPSGLFGPA